MYTDVLQYYLYAAADDQQWVVRIVGSVVSGVEENKAEVARVSGVSKSVKCFTMVGLNR